MTRAEALGKGCRLLLIRDPFDIPRPGWHFQTPSGRVIPAFGEGFISAPEALAWLAKKLAEWEEEEEPCGENPETP
jgi:hypothetical protein